MNTGVTEASLELEEESTRAMQGSEVPVSPVEAQQERAVRGPHTYGVTAVWDAVTSTQPRQSVYCCAPVLPQARGGVLSGSDAVHDLDSPESAHFATVPKVGCGPVPVRLPRLTAVGSVIRGHSISLWCRAVTMLVRRVDPDMEAWWLGVMQEAERTHHMFAEHHLELQRAVKIGRMQHLRWRRRRT